MKEKGEIKRGFYFIIFALILVLLITSIVSAGWFDWLKKTITGQDVKTVTLNISVGAGNAPQVVYVFNNTEMTDVSVALTAGPSDTNVTINFTVYDADGIGNIQDSTVAVNFTQSAEKRENSSTSCAKAASAGQYTNYSCNVTMYWWDSSGTWSIIIKIQDKNGNNGTNDSTNFQVGSTTGFEIAPLTLSWASLSPGAENQTSNNDPLRLNNTGNAVVTTISINATPLTGEITKTDVILAERFSVRLNGSGDIAPNMECNGTMMNESHAYVTIPVANLSVGNYTLNNGGLAQEELYFCLTNLSSALSSQPYSTWGNGTWTISGV